MANTLLLDTVAWDLCIDASGNIAVAWYDCRNSPANNRVEVWGTISTNGGASYLPEVKISAGSTSGVGLGNGNELGDYLGLDFYNGVFRPCWADDSNSTGDNPNGTSELDYYTAAVTLVPAAPVPFCCVNSQKELPAVHWTIDPTPELKDVPIVRMPCP